MQVSSPIIGSQSALVNTPLLLDIYAGATHAYSVRKLRSDYQGSALRVRRSSDNAELDIGFVNNDLDSATMLSFVGGADGFVSVRYDQVGTNNLENTIASEQPRIVQSGFLQTFNGLPTVKYDGTQINRLISNSNIIGNSGAFSIFSVVGYGGVLPNVQDCALSISPFNLNNQYTNLFILYPYDTSNGAGLRVYLRSLQIIDENGIQRTGLNCFSYNQTSTTNRSALINATTIAGGSAQSLNSPNDARIYEGIALVSIHRCNDGVSETIYYMTDAKINDREAIQNNQKIYYGIQ